MRMRKNTGHLLPPHSPDKLHSYILSCQDDSGKITRLKQKQCIVLQLNSVPVLHWHSYKKRVPSQFKVRWPWTLSRLINGECRRTLFETCCSHAYYCFVPCFFGLFYRPQEMYCVETTEHAITVRIVFNNSFIKVIRIADFPEAKPACPCTERTFTWFIVTVLLRKSQSNYYVKQIRETIVHSVNYREWRDNSTSGSEIHLLG